ncbi:transglutaminase-like domain-containing protein [Flavobacteriaceae bacterium MHTCC 0001]
MGFCGILSLSSQTLEEAFTAAGKNRKNLEAVLNYYERTGEKQKYQAAKFLIENMPIQESHSYKWVSNEGDNLNFSEFNYEDFDLALQAFNAIKDSIGIKPLLFKEKDVEVITSKMLIKNIDHAFEAWKNNPWSKSYNFNVFCDYILPYRSLIEPLNEWREECGFLVQRAGRNLEDETDPVEVCTNVMNALKGFTFRYSKSPIPAPLLGTQQLLFRREGSCPELANLAVLASRAIGLAVTYDFTPHYAASSNRHFWNTIIDKNGEAIPFNGSSASDGSGTPNHYDTNHKRMAKVFRKTYAIQNTALASQVQKENIPYSFLWSSNIVDVTKDYVPVGTVTCDFKEQNVTIAYLNVFNVNSWSLVDWSKKEEGVFTFKNMGRDIVYLPSYYENRKTTYALYPILLNKDGEQKILKPNYSKPFNCTLSSTNIAINKYQENNSLTIEAGEIYTLYYWDKTWQRIATSNATIKGVQFTEIPTNALFALMPSAPDNFERIFTINPETNQITWY